MSSVGFAARAADRHPICYLVACVGKKQPKALPARDLYASAWFRKVRSQVESTGCPWFILSAAFGLLHPETVIEPYEKTLNRMPVAERRAWASNVIAQMDRALAGYEEIVVFAGRHYRQFLMDYLGRRFKVVRVPLAGMGIGRQLKWLKTRAHGSEAV
jgi:hypothetical protein